MSLENDESGAPSACRLTALLIYFGVWTIAKEKRVIP